MKITQFPGAITLLTPTRDRPDAFRNAERWMARQDFPGEVRWVVVDDGATPIQPTMGQVYVRRDPSRAGDYPHGTLTANLLAGLSVIGPREDIAIVEDDDWYSPDYVRALVDHLKTHDLVGFAPSRYYNLTWRWWFHCENRKHASLCTTAFSAALHPWFEELVKFCDRRKDQFVDLEAWRRSGGIRAAIVLDASKNVGIKGYPGSPNIGIGRAKSAGKKDPGGQVLREWIGQEEADIILAQAEAWRRDK